MWNNEREFMNNIRSEFSRKSKTYRTKYFDALRQLFGEIEHDKECHTGQSANGETRTDHVCGVVEKAGI